ncbi:MAG: Na+/H+ antiporter NhaA [Planctomycetota bacterium]
MIKSLLKSDAGAGALLVLAAVIAMAVANSPLAAAYESLLEADLRLGIGPLALTKNVLHWINDGLMAVFFMLVGLEIKRELVEGELSDRQRAALPLFGALGGMIAPALAYLAINAGDAAAAPGWPIPVATDIDFALGVLALVRRHVAPGLRIFLLGLAIIDDLGAVILIALLFTSDISGQALTWAAACVAVLVALNRAGVRRLWPFMLVGLLLWLSVLKSGVHATLAGVVIGLCVPLGGRAPQAAGTAATGSDDGSPLRRLEHALQPWVAFAIMPVFALANAGASLEGFGLHTLGEPVTLGILLGLFVGKQVGVFVACRAAVALGFAQLPAGASWRSLYGVAIITGIGLTMSLFIGSLAFPDGGQDTAMRLGVLVGSILSAVAGCLWLLASAARGGSGDQR